MKTRHGFVSNSSSSSFIIDKGFLIPLQIYAIINHGKVAQWISDVLDIAYGCIEYEWYISEDAAYIRGHISMDNFNMREFLKDIGVPDDAIKWEHGG